MWVLHARPDLFCSGAVWRSGKTGAPSVVRLESHGDHGIKELTDEEIKERMSGTSCRCGAYAGIVAAVRAIYGGKNA